MNQNGGSIDFMPNIANSDSSQPLISETLTLSGILEA
jgi:hypothetical protein